MQRVFRSGRIAAGGIRFWSVTVLAGVLLLSVMADSGMADPAESGMSLQPSPTGPAPVDASLISSPVVIPNYWDQRQRPEKPDLTGLRAIRFLTDDDYPPLHFTTDDGKLEGFNVDLARALCDILRVPCTVQARRWDTLLDALKEGRGDAVIASLRITPALRANYGFTQPYLRTPARFASRLTDSLTPGSRNVVGRKVAVVAQSSHEAFLRTFFPQAKLLSYATLEAAQAALKRGDTDLLFGDGLSISLWLAASEGSACCRFAGGPYTESRFFGEGAGIATRLDDLQLRRALDYALYRVAESGAYAELYLRYFPISFY